MAKVIAFSGESNSGKTTLIVKLVGLLKARGKSVAVIKHDPGNKADFDTMGREKNKDSFKFNSVADALAVISPQKSTIFNNNLESESAEFTRILEHFKHYDFIFIEGLKTLPYPRLIIMRDSLNPAYFPYGQIICASNIPRTSFPPEKTILDLNNAEEILEYILNNM